MVDFHYPPPIVEIVKPSEWEGDEDMEFIMVERRMLASYMWVFLLFSMALVVTIMF